MKTADLRHMKNDELNGELSRLERHLFDLRAQAVTEKLADPTQLGKTRRDIARVLTIIREKRLATGRASSAPAEPKPAAATATKKSAPSPSQSKSKVATTKAAKPKKAKTAAK